MRNITIIITLALAAFLSGCAGEISGMIYLDKNANNTMDENETSMANVVYSVTLDGKSFQSGLTEEDGSFHIPKPQPGYYCINVQKTAVSYFNPSTSPTPAVSAMAMTKAAGPKASTTDAVTADSGTTDASTAETADDKTKDETKKEPVPLPPPVNESLKTCINAQGYSEKLTANVAVTMAYEADIATIEPPQDIDISVGETFEWKFWSLASCQPIDYALPSAILPAKKYQMTWGNTLSLSALAPMAEVVKPISLTQDTKIPYVVQLKAASNLKQETTTVELKPSIICQNDQVYQLPAQKVTIKKDKDIRLKPTVEGNVAMGNTLTLSVVVESDSAYDYDEPTMLVMSLPASTTIKSSFCRNLIQQVQCDINHIKANSSSTYKVEFALPNAEDIVMDYEGTIHIELQFYDGTKAIKVDPDITFTLPKP